MTIPRSIKTILPSLKLANNEPVTLKLSDLKELLPSLQINITDKDDPFNGSLGISIDDLRKVLFVALGSVEIDESWYLGQVPGLRRDIQEGKIGSASEHYALHGYLEGRLPKRPEVDEAFYSQQYPDVAASIKAGKIRSGFDHFLRDGYSEGRMSVPPKQERRPLAKTK